MNRLITQDKLQSFVGNSFEEQAALEMGEDPELELKGERLAYFRQKLHQTKSCWKTIFRNTAIAGQLLGSVCRDKNKII